MPTEIPISIRLAHEQAMSFHRCVSIIHAEWKERPASSAHGDVARFFDELLWYGRRHLGYEGGLLLLEKALGWANKQLPPPIPDLREARRLLEETAAAWG